MRKHTDKRLPGGTAGCIIAGRLAEADPNLSILVIEGGANNKDVASIKYPVFYLQNLLPTTKTALFYKGNKSEKLADREPIVPCGGALGGGSSINFMMYTRAQRSDFESWKTEGWSADEMFSYLNKVSTFTAIGRLCSLTIHSWKPTTAQDAKKTTATMAQSSFPTAHTAEKPQKRVSSKPQTKSA